MIFFSSGEREKATGTSSFWNSYFRVFTRACLRVVFSSQNWKRLLWFFFFSRSLKFMEDCVIVPLPVRASHRHVSLPPDFVGQPAKARRCQRRMLVTIVSEKLATYSDAFLFGRAPLQSECVNLWLCRDQRSKRMCCNKRRRCTWVDHGVPAWRSTVWISTVQFYRHPHTSPDPPPHPVIPPSPISLPHTVSSTPCKLCTYHCHWIGCDTLSLRMTES